MNTELPLAKQVHRPLFVAFAVKTAPTKAGAGQQWERSRPRAFRRRVSQHTEGC